MIDDLIEQVRKDRAWFRERGQRVDASACAIREAALRDAAAVAAKERADLIARCARIADRVGDKDLNSDLINEPTQVALGIELAARAIAEEIRRI